MSTSGLVTKQTTSASAPANGKVVPTTGSSTDGSNGASSGPPSGGPKRYQPGIVGLYFLGISLVMAGQYMGWNGGINAGVYSFLIIYIVMGLAYVTFCLCVSEVTSALPFAGGAYGLARCTLGFFPAFLIGCCETFEYVVSVAVLTVSITDVVALSVPSLAGYKPLLWLLYYVPVTILQCIGGASFWIAAIVLGAFEMALLLIYCFGAVGSTDWNTNAVADTSMLYVGGIQEVLRVFPFSAWFFLGIEAVNLASDEVSKPKTQIPIAQVSCVCTLFVTGLFTLLVSVALPREGGLATFPSVLGALDDGFLRIFNIDPTLVTLLSIPSQYAGAYGLSWASAKLIHAMGASKLLPPWLATTSSGFGTPYVGIIVASVSGYGICLLVYYVPSCTAYLLPVCLLFAFSSYSGQCAGYISLRLNYPIVKQSKFKNPFGIYGAIYALIVWIIGIVGILGFQGHNGIELVFFIVLLVGLAIYYVLFAKKRQIMSEEESKVLLVAHISRFNQKRKSRYGLPSSASKKQSIISMPGRLSRMLSSKNTGSSAVSKRTQARS